MQRDTAFQMSASNIRFGPGITREIGMDLQDMSVSRTLVVMDPALRDLLPGESVCESLDQANVDYEVWDAVRVEPTDKSFQDAAKVAADGGFDSFVAVGGGSTIDTAKAANLYATYPADFMEYVNAPLGQGKPVPGPLKPLIAVPTTAGTGSETTGVAIFDFAEIHSKTGIAHRYMKPTLGLVDPNNTRTMPASVAAATGLDVLSHALESFTALPFDQRPMPARPLERPAYQGANPLSDIWSLRALEIVAEFLPRAYSDPSDDEARGEMMLAAAMAGVGFGNAGVHLPHGMSYPVASMVREYQHPGYDVDHPLIPHGISVILNTPSVVRFTASANRDRHLQAAAALGADISGASPDQAADILAQRVCHIMRQVDVPNGLAAVGYTENDVPALVRGTLPQHRVTKLSPIPAEEKELTELFLSGMTAW